MILSRDVAYRVSSSERRDRAFSLGERIQLKSDASPHPPCRSRVQALDSRFLGNVWSYAKVSEDVTFLSMVEFALREGVVWDLRGIRTISKNFIANRVVSDDTGTCTD